MADSVTPYLLPRFTAGGAARQRAMADRPRGEPPATVELEIPWREEMPKTRAGCLNRPRPCPWFHCVHNLSGVEVAENGSITLRGVEADGRDKVTLPVHRNPTGRTEEEFMEQAADRIATRWRSCVLDVASDAEGVTLREVGEIFNLSRERIRQIEESAAERLRDCVPVQRLARLMLRR